MTEPRKLLVEVPVTLIDTEWSDQDLTENSVYFFAAALDNEERVQTFLHPNPPFTVSNDVTVYTPEGYAEDHQIHKARVIDTPEGVTFTPWSDGYAVGFKVTAPGKQDRYVMLNPSSETDTGKVEDSDVFVYNTTHPEPSDSPLCYVNIWEN